MSDLDFSEVDGMTEAGERRYVPKTDVSSYQR